LSFIWLVDRPIMILFLKSAVQSDRKFVKATIALARRWSDPKCSRFSRSFSHFPSDHANQIHTFDIYHFQNAENGKMHWHGLTSGISQSHFKVMCEICCWTKNELLNETRSNPHIASSGVGPIPHLRDSDSLNDQIGG